MTVNTEQLYWRRSSRCGSTSCVEVASLAATVLLRDSKHPLQAALEFDHRTWRTFVGGLKRDAFPSR